MSSNILNREFLNWNVLEFDNVRNGLLCKGEEPTGFTICGNDGNFVNANASVCGSRVIVRSYQVLEPVAVRYGWADYPEVNLYNSDRIPMSPLRTDEFLLSTQSR